MSSLTPLQQRFVLHWGEMGTRWGINRTVAQVHALLFLSPQPLHADQICRNLGVARSHISNSLRELQGWGIIRRVHVLGDRRDHFESLTDVWEMFRRILDERKKREIDPTLALLRQALAEAANEKSSESYTVARLKDLKEFLETTTTWFMEVRSWPVKTLLAFLQLSDKTRRLLGVGR